MPAQKSLKDLAKENPTQIGDPVSLKAETSNTEPIDQDRPVKSSTSQTHNSAPCPTEGNLPDGSSGSLKNQDLAGTGGKKLPYDISSAPAPTEGDLDQQEGNGKKSLKNIAMENPTQLGDPISLKAETSNTEPTDQDRGALKKKKKGSKL